MISVIVQALISLLLFVLTVRFLLKVILPSTPKKEQDDECAKKHGESDE